MAFERKHTVSAGLPGSDSALLSAQGASRQAAAANGYLTLFQSQAAAPSAEPNFLALMDWVDALDASAPAIMDLSPPALAPAPPAPLQISAPSAAATSTLQHDPALAWLSQSVTSAPENDKNTLAQFLVLPGQRTTRAPVALAPPFAVPAFNPAEAAPTPATNGMVTQVTHLVNALASFSQGTSTPSTTSPLQQDGSAAPAPTAPALALSDLQPLVSALRQFDANKRSSGASTSAPGLAAVTEPASGTNSASTALTLAKG